MIDARKPQILKGCLAQILKNAILRCLGRDDTCANPGEKRLQILRIHATQRCGQKSLRLVDFAASPTLISGAELFDGLILL